MLLGGVPKRVVNQHNAKVFGRKGASVETENVRDVALDRKGSIEEKDLGFVLVTVQA